MSIDEIKAKYKVTEQRATPRAATSFRQRSTGDLAVLVNASTERASLSQGRDSVTSNEMAQVIGDVAKARVEMAQRMVEYQGYQTELKDLLGKNPGLIRAAQLLFYQKLMPGKYSAKVGEYAAEGIITVQNLVDKMANVIIDNRERLVEIRALEKRLKGENLERMKFLQDEHIGALRASAHENFGSTELDTEVNTYRSDIQTVDMRVDELRAKIASAQQQRDLKALGELTNEMDGLYGVKRTIMSQLETTVENATGKRLGDLRTANKIESTRQAYTSALTLNETLDAMAESTEGDLILYDHLKEYHLDTLKANAQVSMMATEKDKIHKAVTDFAWFQEVIMETNARAADALAYETLDMVTRDVLDDAKLASVRATLAANREKRIEVANEYTSFINRSQEKLETPGTQRYNPLAGSKP